MHNMIVADGDTLLFTGDSITDCGRGRPVGKSGNLGDGYVACVNSLIEVVYPERRIRVLNTGIGGNRVIDLADRWQQDVVDLKPDWLAIMIGINDVWRQFDAIYDSDQVPVERYETVFRQLLAKTRPALKGLVLMSPYYIEPQRHDPMRACMDVYGRTVKRLAADHDAVFVDVQNAFDRFLSHRPPQSLGGDRVHPNKTGHCIIAKAFLTAIGFEWNP